MAIVQSLACIAFCAEALNVHAIGHQRQVQRQFELTNSSNIEVGISLTATSQKSNPTKVLVHTLTTQIVIIHFENKLSIFLPVHGRGRRIMLRLQKSQTNLVLQMLETRRVYKHGVSTVSVWTIQRLCITCFIYLVLRMCIMVQIQMITQNVSKKES